jgi:hypothetical protein
VPRLNPDAVLADRYARGEIDEQEFLRRRQTLRDAATLPGDSAQRGTPSPTSLCDGEGMWPIRLTVSTLLR